MPIVDGFEANRILQSVTFGSNKEHTIATDNYASAREWIGVKGRNLLPPPHCCILRHHLSVTIHSKSPSAAQKQEGYNDTNSHKQSRPMSVFLKKVLM